MIDAIRLIPGPLFLCAYAVFACACILMGRFWIYGDGSLGHPIPDLTRFEPLSLSYLKGGRPAVIRTAVFDLWKRGLVSIGGTKANATLKQAHLGHHELSTKMRGLKPVALIIYEFLDKKRKSAELFRSAELKGKLDLQLQLAERELAQWHLVKTGGDTARAVLVSATTLTVMLLPGVTKMYLGLERGKPVAFLFLLLVASVIGLLLALKPWSKASGLGREYLAKLAKDFGWIKEKAKRTGFVTGIDPAFAVAVFGPAVFAAEPGYREYKSAFRRSSGASCGGCSGTSGGCSGGGCSSGGGCGGGGCGGCGG